MVLTQSSSTSNQTSIQVCQQLLLISLSPPLHIQSKFVSRFTLWFESHSPFSPPSEDPACYYKTGDHPFLPYPGLICKSGSPSCFFWSTRKVVGPNLIWPTSKDSLNKLLIRFRCLKTISVSIIPRQVFQSPPPRLPTRAEERIRFDVLTHDEPPRRFRSLPTSHKHAGESFDEIQAMKAQLKYLRRQARPPSGVETMREVPSQQNSRPPPPRWFESSNYRSRPPPSHSSHSQYHSSVPQRPRRPMIPIQVIPKSSDDEGLDQFSDELHLQDSWLTDQSFKPWFHTSTRESFTMSSDVSSNRMTSS